MKIYDELVARGLIAQVTDEDEIQINRTKFGKITNKIIIFVFVWQ